MTFYGRSSSTLGVSFAAASPIVYRGSPRQDGSEHIVSPKISRSAQPENLSTVSQTVSGEGESGLITIDARLVALYYTLVTTAYMLVWGCSIPSAHHIYR